MNLRMCRSIQPHLLYFIISYLRNLARVTGHSIDALSEESFELARGTEDIPHVWEVALLSIVDVRP